MLFICQFASLFHEDDSHDSNTVPRRKCIHMVNCKILVQV